MLTLINKLNLINNNKCFLNKNYTLLLGHKNTYYYVLANTKKYLFLDIVGFDFISQNFSLNIRDKKSFHFFSLLISSKKKLYSHNNWMFREYNEFFSFLFFSKTDNRNLLLDYNCTYNPLKKHFPVTGKTEVFYNFNHGFIDQININNIEL